MFSEICGSSTLAVFFPEHPSRPHLWYAISNETIGGGDAEGREVAGGYPPAASEGFCGGGFADAGGRDGRPADDEEALLTGGRMAQVRDILAAEGRCLIVASIHALLQPVPDPKALDAVSKTLRLNEDFPFDTLAETLTGLGYEREELVVEPLTFALRGGILDVWPAGAAQPVRAEFFGDTVDLRRHGGQSARL